MMSGASQQPGKSTFLPQPDQAAFWTSEIAGTLTVLRFNSDAILAGVNLRDISTLWQFLHYLIAQGNQFLHVSMSEGGLGHDSIGRIYSYFQNMGTGEYLNDARDYRQTTELVRQDVALQRFIRYLRDERIFVAGDIRGEIDINYLGLMLACDYRIACEDTVIINSGYPMGKNFGTATPWFLARLLGPDQALNILSRCERLSARRALKLGIFHQLTTTQSHAQETLNISQKLAAHGTERLLAAKQAIHAATISLESYFQTFGAGIDKMIIGNICCSHCGYNLTGNVSGRCPECGTLVEATQHNIWSQTCINPK